MPQLRHSRRWLFLLAFLAALSLAAPARALPADPYLTGDTEWVTFINVQQMFDSPVFKKLALKKIKAALQEDEVQQVLDSLGLDPLRDIASITIAGPGGNDDDKKGIVIIHGKFDLAKFRAKAEEVAKAKEDLLKIHKEGDNTIYETSVPSPEGSKPMYVALVDETTLVASGSKDYVVEALDKKADKKKPTLKKEVQELVEKIDSKQTISFAGLGSAVGSNPLGGDNPANTGEKIKTFKGALHLSNDISLDVVVAAKDAASAKDVLKDLKEGLKQAKGFLGFFALNQKELTPFVDALDVLKLDSEGNNVTIKGQITGDMIEKSLKKDNSN